MASFKNIAILKSGFDYCLNYYFNNIKSIETLEPLSVIINLAILSGKPSKTKIAIYDNKIHIQSPNLSQSIKRSLRGNNREELSFLLKPIIRFTELYHYSNFENYPSIIDNLINIVKLSILGLQKIKKNYSKTSTVNHSIDLYICILDSYIQKESNKFIENYQNSKQELDLKLSIQTKINLGKIFTDIWSVKEIELISDLLLSYNKEPKKTTLSSINNILSIKDVKIKNSIEHIKNII